LHLIREAGIPWVDFSGGEPLLHPDVIQIFKFSRELGLLNTLSTNGLLVYRFIDRIFPYVDQWNISLHGTQFVHNEIVQHRTSHQSILKACEMIAARGGVVHITYVVTSENILDVRQSIEDMVNVGVKKICFNYVFRRGQGIRYLTQRKMSQDQPVDFVKEVVESFPTTNLTIYHNMNLDGQCALIRADGQIWGVPMSNNLDFEVIFQMNHVHHYARKYPYMLHHRKFTFPRLGPIFPSTMTFDMLPIKP
jgi:MoaA/NifB/PqqE/SkfB family radical SAM enzyme